MNIVTDGAAIPSTVPTPSPEPYPPNLALV